MAQITLITNDRISVKEDYDAVKAKITTTLEAIEIGFVEFTQNARVESFDGDSQIIEEPICLNRAHIVSVAQ